MTLQGVNVQGKGIRDNTGTQYKEGESDEIVAAHVVMVDKNGPIVFLDSNGNLKTGASNSEVDSVSSVPLYLIGQFSTITDNVMTISELADSIDIENFGATDFTITINSKTITIKAGRIYNDLTFETPFTTITFSTPNPTSFQLIAKKRGY